MTSVIQKERELSEYLLEWVNTYYRKWNPFYYETRQNKDAMRAQLLHANRLLGVLNSIIGNLEGHFEIDEGQHVIPSCFPSIENVIAWLLWMKEYLNKHMPIIEENYARVGSNYTLDNIR